MKPRRNLLTLILAAPLIPAIGSAAPPWQQATEAAHNSLLGCRWRRCAPVVPVMPRADDAERLLLNFDKGPPYYVELNTETRTAMKVMGQNVAQTQTLTFYLQWTPEGKNQLGHGMFRIKIIGIKTKIDIGGVVIDYDSTQDRPNPAPLADFFTKLLDADFKLTIDPRESKVSKIEGHDELIRKLGVTQPQMEPLLKSIMSQGLLTQMVTPVFGFVPQQAVQRGDTWERPHVFDLGPIGSYRSVNQYTYDRKEESRVRIVVQSQLRYEAPKEKAGLPFQIRSADLKSTTGAGEIVFDTAKGRLVESTLRQALSGTLTIEVGGMETLIELDQHQTTRIWVRDANPLAERK